MNDSHEFDLGRAHGRNGSGWTLKETEAYRQGRIAGAIERQNELLKEQAHEEARRREDLAQIEKELQWQEEWLEEKRLRETEEARRHQENQKNRKREIDFYCSAIAEQLFNAKKGKLSSVLQVHALYFAQLDAQELSWASDELERLMKAASKHVPRNEPELPVELVDLARSLQEFRNWLSKIGFVLPFDQIPKGRDFRLHSPQATPTFSAATAPVWLEHGPGLPIDFDADGSPVSSAVIKAAISRLEETKILSPSLRIFVRRPRKQRSWGISSAIQRFYVGPKVPQDLVLTGRKGSLIWWTCCTRIAYSSTS